MPIDLLAAQSGASEPQDLLAAQSSDGGADLSSLDRVNTPYQNASPQASPINFGDMLKMAALTDPKEQQNFLKSKFSFAEQELDPNGRPTGNFHVGNDPTNLVPIHPGTMGDTALNIIAKGAAMIPVIAGQMAGATLGAAAGTLAEGGIPGPGTVAGGIAGAGIGSAIGEGAKNLAMSRTPGFDPEKAAADTVISGLFGAAGEGLGQAISFSAKTFIAPKVAAALDGAVQRSENPSGTVAFMAKLFNFVGNVDPKTTVKTYKYGFKNVFGDERNLDPNHIDNIAQNVFDLAASKLISLKNGLDEEENSLLSANPGGTVPTGDLLERITDRLHQATVIRKYPADGSGMLSTFEFRDDAPAGTKTPDVVNFLKRLGAKVSREPVEGGESAVSKMIFTIPEGVGSEGLRIPLSDAIGAKQLFGKAFMEKENGQVSAIFKTALYGKGPSADYPNGFVGLRDGINSLAQATDHGGYVLANDAYSKFIQATEGVIQKGGKPIPGWMDMSSPSKISGYLKNINNKDSFQTTAMQNLRQELGKDFIDPSSKWACAQGVLKAKPQMLRLGIVAGLLSTMMPGDTVSKASRVPLAFALGSGAGIRTMGIGSEAVAATGKQILSKLAQGATSNVGRAALSQLVGQNVGR